MFLRNMDLTGVPTGLAIHYMLQASFKDDAVFLEILTFYESLKICSCSREID